MDQMTVCSVKVVTQTHRKSSANSAVPLSYVDCFSVFHPIVLVFWPTVCSQKQRNESRVNIGLEFIRWPKNSLQVNANVALSAAVCDNNDNVDNIFHCTLFFLQMKS